MKNYNSTLKVEKGSLNIGNVSKASLSLNSNSYIKKDTLVNINSNGEIKLNGGSITLDDNDIWAGNISIGDKNNIGSGALTIDGLKSNGEIFANGGTINILNKGELTASTNDVIKDTSTDKEIFTPIGYYNLQSAGGGWYTSNMTRYNPQVFRGQVATLASFNNQLMIDDMLLNHVTLDSERTLAQSRNANRYASTLPQFAPYQYKKEDGGLWYKSYVNFENLSLTQGLKVGNNSYGSLIGADFPVINMKRGWKFMPTAYIGYNGAHQTFNGVGMYQNGGQGGFMGTFMKNDFIGSVLAYGGGYNNEMSVAGYTDITGNWFAGTAAKLVYNFHPTKHFTIQPTAFMSYNIFGRQNWGTDFGSMSMNSGLLNGINVAPGLNFIYARESWSVYATFQYMYNINDQVGGRAGNVDLASVKMEHGYIQYGLGVTKTWKDRLNSFFQIVFRNGGRTGVGFQLGLNYTFDWFSPSKTKSTKATKGEKTIIKSLSMK